MKTKGLREIQGVHVTGFSVLANGRKKMNKRLLVGVLLSALVMVANGQVSELTKQGKIRIGSAFGVGISTAMPNYDATLTNYQMAKLSAALDVNVFAIDNLAFNIRLMGNGGRLLSDLGNSDVSLLGIGAAIGLEYYFNLSEKNQLAAGVAFGSDEFGFFCNNKAARYENWVLPLSVTFWHNRIGYSVSYEWCVGKTTPKNNAALLPKMAPGFVMIGVRYR